MYKKYICIICGYIYDEEKGLPEDNISEKTIWQDIPDEWLCPECGVGKDQFELLS